MSTFRILGPVEVWRDAERLALGGRRQVALLSMLLVHANQAVARDELVEALWGDGGDVRRLQVTVARLRKALGPLDGPGGDPLLLTVGGGYSLSVAAGELDAECFVDHVRDGRAAIVAGELDRGVHELRSAEGLWRGPALADVAYEPFAQAEVRRLDELRLAAIESRLDAELELGRHQALVGELESLVAKEPTHERFAGQLMLALYRCGRQADALAVFARTRAHLNDELALEPGAELRRLQERILRHDSVLVPAPPTPLPDALDAALATTIHGRERELATLREAWARARTGPGIVVSVSGERGSGATRLAAELAAEVHAGGAVVVHDEQPPEARPALVVVPDSAATIPCEPRVLTLVYGPNAHHVRADVALELGPLDAAGISAIAAEYGAYLPLEQIARESNGLPARVHESARRHAAAAAGRRVDEAAARAVAGREQLHSLEADLAGGVAELQALRATSAPLTDVVCPFKGLAPFDVDDSEFFCGRERLVAELVARLVGTELLGIVGPSGSGKSSLLRAGLLPALAGGVLPGSERWRQVVIRPGERVDQHGRTIVAVDQFEEAFTTLDEPERDAFIAHLMQLDCTVVLALRADQYGRCADYPALANALTRNHVLVPPMRPDELRQAIELPARRARLELEGGLAEKLIKDVADEPGALPLLSSTLLDLWQRRDGRRLRLAAYEQTGGVRAAVARLGEDAYGALTPDERDTARRLLLRLVAEPQEGTFERRRLPLPHDEQELHVIDRLAERRLLTVSEGTVEVVHEALFREWPRLRAWLEQDAEARHVRRRLAEATRNWEDGGRAPHDLYRGGRLAAALELQHDLDPAEHAFLAAGRAAESRGRRRLQAGVVTLALLLLVAATAGVLALRQRGRALDVARTAQAQRLGALALGEPALDRALLLAAQGVALDDSATTRSQLLSALQRSPAAIWTLRQGTAWSAGDIAPDGRTLILGDETGRLVFLDPRTRRASEPLTVSSGSPFFRVRFSPDGTRVAAATGSLVMLIDARTRRVIKDWPADNMVLDVAFSADSRTLLVSTGRYAPTRDVVRASEDMSLEILRWDRDGRQVDAYPRATPERGAVFVGFDRDRNLVSVKLPPERGTTIRDPQTFAELRRFPQGTWPASLSPGRETLAFAQLDGSVNLLDLGAGAVRTLGRHRGSVATLGFATRDLLASGGDDGETIVWDVRRGTTLRAASGHAGAVGAALVTADGRTLYSAGRDGALVKWDLTGQRGLGRSLGADFEPPLVAAADGSAFAVGSLGRAFTVYAGRTLAVTRRRVLEGSDGGWASALTSTSLASSSFNGPVVLADTRSGRRFDVPAPFSVYRLALSRDDRWIALLDTEGSWLRLVDRRGAMRNPRSVAIGTGQDSPNPVFDPAGRWVAAVAGTTHNELQIRSIPRLDVLRRVRVPRSSAETVSADGRTVAVGDQSGRTWLFDTATLAPAGPALERREGGGPIAGLSFGGGGHLLVASSARGPARLWDLTSSPPTSTALDVGARVVDAAFVGDGWTLVTLDEARELRAWDLHPRALLRRACATAGRSLTRDEWRELVPDRPYAPVC